MNKKITYEHVSGGKRCYEIIARLPYTSVDEKCEKYENISGNGEYNAEGKAYGDKNRLPQFEWRQDGR